MSKTLLQITATKEHGALLITAEVKNNVAYLSIDGYISSWGDASARSLKNEVKRLKASEAELYLNTEGGDCFQAKEIVNILNDEYGKDNVKLRVGSLAASAGAYILARYSKNATGKPNSQFMIHKPKGGFHGDAAKIKQEVKLLEDMEDEYRELFASTLGMTAKQIDKKWNAGDWWLTATEALDLNLISEIEDEDEEITPESRLRLVAVAAPNIPNEQIQKPDTMNTQALALSMGLPKDATEVEIQAKAIELKAQADKSNGLQAKLDNQEKESKDAKIKAMLDQAENVDKKITGEQRPMLEAMANNDFDNAEKYINSLNPIAAIPVTPGATTPGSTTVDASQDKWTFEDYQKAENGHELLATLEEADPAKYNALVEAHYKE